VFTTKSVVVVEQNRQRRRFEQLFEHVEYLLGGLVQVHQNHVGVHVRDGFERGPADPVPAGDRQAVAFENLRQIGKSAVGRVKEGNAQGAGEIAVLIIRAH
jgi:hypothetical protein